MSKRSGNFHIRTTLLGRYSNLAREIEQEPEAGTVPRSTVSAAVPSGTVQLKPANSIPRVNTT